MVLSASRRTDIPNYYSDWFFHRIKEGYLYVRNPMNARQISRVALSPETVDCIVFWTKNPEPMLSRLEELKGYPYYFQFTLTGFGSDVECNVPHKKEYMLPVFKKLAGKIGRERVVWRYDPIIFTDKYTPEYHLKAFGQIAWELRGFTAQCVISFVDRYSKIRKNMEELGAYALKEGETLAFGRELARIAEASGIRVTACAEKMDLSPCGIGRSSCIDKEQVERIAGGKIRAGRDRNQRKECGCIESVEIGAYDTCLNGCRYCYANAGRDSILRSRRLYDAASPLLCGRVSEGDSITERKMETCRVGQIGLWD